ncbi:50S ribosomal protein L1 [Patescibacteria group bacterium]|nr:50S ribosomal protein L1 [Patescibacteria group bacterium]MBU1673504.1 50S ribosomal protein L1 [Patescibacteria group bacterium]MBU1963750.1 50S ribosomal protein L1 [Patescibacteria group bacterium]
MKKRSKRYNEALKQIDKSKKYPLEEALKLVLADKTKFDQSVEVHLRLGIDPKKGEQLVRGQVVLPHGTGKEVKIMAFVGPEKEAEAKGAGADIIGGESEIQKIKETGKIDFDIAVATPDIMKKIGPIAKILGQKGLMPNPKTGTIGPNVAAIIKELKAGKVGFKNDDSANIHQLVGKASFNEDNLKENINVFIAAVQKAKPAKAKGTYIKGMTICTSMGPGIKVIA